MSGKSIPEQLAADQETTSLLMQLHEQVTALRYMYDYRAYITECLGYDFWQVKEPRVLGTLDKVGALVNEWFEERPYQRVRKKAMFIRPRGSVKSGTVTEPLPTWVHLRDKNIACATMSAKEDMAIKFATTTRSLWLGHGKNNRLTDTFGTFFNTTPSSSSMTTTWRDNNRGDPTLKALSVRQGATSGHYDLFIMDDPTTAEVVKEDDKWKLKVRDQYIACKAVTNRDSLFILICTRYGDDDIVGYIIETEIKPAVKKVFGRLPEDFGECWWKYGKYAGWTIDFDDCFVPVEEGDENYDQAVELGEMPGRYVLNYPEIWSKEMIEDALNDPEKGQAWVWEQLQNRPSKRPDNPITQHHIDMALCDIHEVPAAAFSYLTMHCDTAWKDQANYLLQRGDWNVIQIWGHHEGHVYLLWQAHGRWKQDEFGQHFIRGLQWAQGFQIKDPQTKQFKRVGHPVRLVTYDKPKGGQGTNKPWFFRTASNAGLVCPAILEIPRNENKIKGLGGILSVTGFWQDGRVHVVRDLPGNEELFYEMMNIGYSAHDDHADAAKDVFHEQVYRPGRKLDVSAFEETGRGTRCPPVAHGFMAPDGRWVPSKRGSSFGKTRLRQLMRVGGN